MKKIMSIICAATICSTAALAQDASGRVNEESKDTVVVIVEHVNAENFFEQTGKPFYKVYKVIECAFVDGYKTVENTFTNGYKTVENVFTEPFNDTESTSRMYRKHYRADIGLSWRNRNMWEISTSHGYSFGNGLYVGGGTGFGAEVTKTETITATETDNTPEHSYTIDSNWEATYLVPVFAELKYSFINRLASPFVNLRIGGYVDVTNKGIRTFANPAIGIDIDRFSIKAGYEYLLGCWGHDKGMQKHSVRLDIGFSF